MVNGLNWSGFKHCKWSELVRIFLYWKWSELIMNCTRQMVWIDLDYGNWFEFSMENGLNWSGLFHEKWYLLIRIASISRNPHTEDSLLCIALEMRYWGRSNNGNPTDRNIGFMYWLKDMIKVRLGQEQWALSVVLKYLPSIKIFCQCSEIIKIFTLKMVWSDQDCYMGNVHNW